MNAQIRQDAIAGTEQAIDSHTIAVRDLMAQHGRDEVIGSIINKHLDMIQDLKLELKELKGL